MEKSGIATDEHEVECVCRIFGQAGKLGKYNERQTILKGGHYDLGYILDVCDCASVSSLADSRSLVRTRQFFADFFYTNLALGRHLSLGLIK